MSDQYSHLPTLGDSDSLLLPDEPTFSENRVIYHISTKPDVGLQSSDNDLTDNQLVVENSVGSIDTECDDDFRDDVNLEQYVTSLAEQVLSNFRKLQNRLHSACTQLKLLRLKRDAIGVRHERTTPNTSNKFSLEMQLSTVRGIMDMYEVFAKRKLQDLFYIYYNIKGTHFFPGVHYDEVDYDDLDIEQIDNHLEATKDDVMEDLKLSLEQSIAMNLT